MRGLKKTRAADTPPQRRYLRQQRRPPLAEAAAPPGAARPRTLGLQHVLLRETPTSASSLTKTSAHRRTEKEKGEEHQKIRNFDLKDLPQSSMDRDETSAIGPQQLYLTDPQRNS